MEKENMNKSGDVKINHNTSLKGRVKVTLQDSIQKINKNKRKLAPPKGLCEMTEMWHIGKDSR